MAINPFQQAPNPWEDYQNQQNSQNNQNQSAFQNLASGASNFLPQNQPQAPQQQQSNPFNYEQARDAWMSGRYSRDEAGASQWANEHGIQYGGGDTITLPNGGGQIDILGNWAGGKGNGQAVTNNWTPAGGNGPNPNGQPIGGGSAGFTGFPPTSGTPTNPPPPPGVSAELYNLLLTRAKQGTTIDRNDPNIRQQVDPYAAAQERARRNYLADAAEQLGPNTNLRGEQRLAMERAGQASGLFESQLLGRELENRRAEIQNALDSLGNRLTADQQLALQKELGYLNDATQRYGIDKNAQTAQGQLELGRQNLGLNYSELDWRMDPRNPANWQF